MSKQTYRNLIALLVTLYIGCLAFNAYLYTLSSHTTIWNYLFALAYGAIYLVGGSIGIAHARKQKLRGNEMSKPLQLFGLGVLMWGIGQLLWVAQIFFLQTSVPYPSIADVFYNGIYLFIGLGLWQYQETLSKDGDAEFPWLSALPIIIIACLMIIVVLRRPDLSMELSFWHRVQNTIAALGDAFIISMAIAAVMMKKLRSFGFGIFLLGILIFTAADFTFVYQDAKDIFWNGAIADTLFATGGFVLSLGIVKMLKDNISLKH